MHALAPNVSHFIDTHTLLSRFITFEICGIIKVLTYEDSQYIGTILRIFPKLNYITKLRVCYFN